MKEKLFKWFATLLLIVIAFFVIAYGVALYYFPDFDMYFFEIDRCLDAGGSWNKTLKACEYSEY